MLQNDKPIYIGYFCANKIENMRLKMHDTKVIPVEIMNRIEQV